MADTGMPGMSGLNLQARVNAQRCHTSTIFITAHGDEALWLQAMRAGAMEFLPKPFATSFQSPQEVYFEDIRQY
jgi:FixJ family two-component response regulator